MKNSRNTSRSNGFTLIELMVAMTITTLIVTILVSITAISLDTWTRSRAEVRAARQAKSMADTMAKDFESMVSRRGTDMEWISAVVEDVVAQGKEPAIASTNAADLIFYTSPTDRYEGDLSADTSIGDVSCVGYRLKYQDPIQSQGGTAIPSFVFYRLLVNPDETFEKLLGNANEAEGGLKTAFDAAFSSDLDEAQNFVCENIFQFTITFNVTVSKSGTDVLPTPITVPVTLGNNGNNAADFSLVGGTIFTDYSPTSSSVSSDDVKNGTLTSVEISLTVLTDTGIDQMRNRRFNSATEESEFLAKNSFQYSKLVQISAP